jgi:hypothetical protein
LQLNPVYLHPNLGSLQSNLVSLQLNLASVALNLASAQLNLASAQLNLASAQLNLASVALNLASLHSTWHLCTPSWGISITLKAFANSSPGFALKPWVHECIEKCYATLKELHPGSPNRSPVATLSELRRDLKAHFKTQGFRANPGLEFANAFSVIL